MSFNNDGTANPKGGVSQFLFWRHFPEVKHLSKMRIKSGCPVRQRFDTGQETVVTNARNSYYQKAKGFPIYFI